MANATTPIAAAGKESNAIAAPAFPADSLEAAETAETLRAGVLA